jgi:phosphohistidine phosphatase
MMIIYFLRHGLAEEREGWDADDSQRPLTEKGTAQLEQQSRKFSALKLDLSLILSSPLIRARQTAEILAKRLGISDRLVIDSRLRPGFNLEMLSEVLKEYPQVENLMLVGHEPDFSDTISSLIGGGRIVCKKGGLARVDIFLREPLQGELVWLAAPRLLLS